MAKINSKSQGWTTPADIRLQIQRLWDRGELLRCVVERVADDEVRTEPEQLFFPYRLRLKKPRSHDIGEQFTEVRKWIQSLTDIRYTRLEQIEIRHPQLGRNTVPQALWIDSLDDALAFIGKRADASQFVDQVQQLKAQDSKLIGWVNKRPRKVLELAPVWTRLLKVHGRIVKCSGNTLYLRQLSVEGVDTKFIEMHRGILAEWLDLTLPQHSIDENYRGSRGFARRYGFKSKPERLRLRSLDGRLPLIRRADKRADHACDADSIGDIDDSVEVINTADITLDVDVIRALDPDHSCIVITENEINYLVLPDRENTIAIFGSGYGLQALGEIDWLKQRDVWYWGDIDTHGFAILNELRARFPGVRSLLMDRHTLVAHEPLWGSEPTPAKRHLEHLNDDEVELYRDIVEHRYGECLRLEQEQIDYAWMLARLEDLSHHGE